jgi:hypothetical protein
MCFSLIGGKDIVFVQLLSSIISALDFPSQRLRSSFIMFSKRTCMRSSGKEHRKLLDCRDIAPGERLTMGGLKSINFPSRSQRELVCCCRAGPDLGAGQWSSIAFLSRRETCYVAWHVTRDPENRCILLAALIIGANHAIANWTGPEDVLSRWKKS